MKCEECSNMLFDYLWGTLDTQTAANLKAHLDSGCSFCNQELELLQGSTFALASELVPIQPPADVKDRVMSHVSSADGKSQTLHSPAMEEAIAGASLKLTKNLVSVAPARTGSSWKRWAPALAGCLIGALCGFAAVRTASHHTPERAGEVADQGNQQNMRSGVRLVKLSSANATDDKSVQPAGHVVFDLVANQVHVLTSKLLDSSPTTDYNVWVSDSKDQNVLLGKLQKSDTQGVWFNYFDLPNNVTSIDQIAIARSNGDSSTLSQSDVRLLVRVAPPVILKN